MARTVTDDEIGKRVISSDGEDLGMVASVEEQTAYVEPEPGFIDKIKGAVGWESESEDIVPIPTEAVAEITDDEVHLAQQFTEGTPDVGTEMGGESTGTMHSDEPMEGTHESEGPITEIDDEGDDLMGDDSSEGSLGAEPIDADQERGHGDTDDELIDPMDEETEFSESEEDISNEGIEDFDEGGAGGEMDPMADEEEIHEPEHIREEDEEQLEPEELGEDDEEEEF